MEQVEYLWARVARNLVSRFGGIAISIPLNLVLIPFIISHIGITAFGIWALVNGLVGYFGILDLGLGQTLVKATAEYLAKRDFRGLSQVTSTIAVIDGVIGAFTGGLILLSVPFANTLFQVSEADVGILRTVLIIVSVQLSLGFPMSIWSSLVAGMEDYHVTNFIRVSSSVLRAIFVFVLLHLGFGLVSLIWIGFGVAIADWFLHFAWIKRQLPGLKVTPFNFAIDKFRQVSKVSGAMFIWGIAGRSVLEIDRLIIGFFLPVARIAVYEIGLRINNYSRVVLYSAHTILPTASHLNARQEDNTIANLYLRVTRYLLFVYATVVATLLVFGEQFVALWVGPEFDESLPIMGILLIATLYQAQNIVGHVILPSLGRLRLFTKLNLLYPSVKIGSALLLTYLYGIVGTAISTAITYGIVETLYLVILLKTFRIGKADFARSCYLPIVAIIVPLAAASYILELSSVASSWIGLIVATSIFSTLSLVLFLIFATTREERGLLKSVAAGLSTITLG